MNGYTTVSEKYIGFHNGRSMFKVTILVDTEEDIPEPKDEWCPGSMCQIADAHQYKVLNNKGEWV